MERTRSVLASDRGRFLAAGALLLAMAAAFLWQYLDPGIEYGIVLIAAASAAAALASWPRKAPWIGFAGLALCALGGGAWFAGSGEPAILPALIVTFGGCVAATLVAYPRARARNDALTAAFAWYSLAGVVLVATWVFYFRFLTLGLAETHVVRRMVLTLSWLLIGIGTVISGRRRDEAPIANAGQILVAAALAKAVFYDTTHMWGPVRIASLAVAGLFLLGGARLLRRAQA